LIKRLLDNGMRPAKVVGLGLAELEQLLHEAPQVEQQHSVELLGLLQLIKTHQSAELRLALHRAMLKQGLHEFLSKTISPLNHLVGDAWLRGEIRVFEEHLYSEQLTTVLRTVIASLRHENGSPRVLLSTLPGEEHGLGLLMAEATLSLYGASCVMLGVQTPISEIVLAVKAHQSDVLVLSFSSAMPQTQVKAGIEQLRKALPRTVALWAGGAGVARLRKPEEGVQLMGPLSDLLAAAAAWCEAQQ
jgi:methanogenic corrinoid protein MtbC1